MTSGDQQRFNTRTARTGGHYGAPKKRQSGRNSVITVIIITLFVGGVVAALIFLMSGETPSHAYAQRSCNAIRPSPMELNACLKAKCTFDVTSCATPCPFGYKLGEDGICEESCGCASEGRYQSDMAFTEQDVLPMAKAYDYSTEEKDFEVFFGSAYELTKQWDHHRSKGRFSVYFEFTSVVAESNKALVLERIKEISEKTCVDFKERKNEEMPYFQLDSDDGCWSYVGYTPSIPNQQLSLGSGCYTARTIKHELIHILGFEHEQSRPDRDAHVDILFENVLLPDGEGQFKKLTRENTKNVYTPYEIHSALHYGSWIFSMNSVDPSLVDRLTGKPIEELTDTTEGDLEEVNMLYGCLEKIDGQWTKWSDWTLCDNTCGQGLKARYRRCEDTSGKLVDGCKGENMESQECEGDGGSSPTKPPGKWGPYSEDGTCSKTCGGGSQVKHRVCLPDKSHCEGSNSVVVGCNSEECPGIKGLKALWSDWVPWSACSVTCGGGVRKRSRICRGSSTEKSCKLETGSYAAYEQQNSNCNPEECEEQPSSGSNIVWGEWSACSMTCDGMRTRSKECMVDAECTDAEITDSGPAQTEECNVGVCKTVVPWFVREYWEKVPEVLCGRYDGNLWYFGDFNGDDRMDVMCRNSAGVYQMGQTNVFGSVSTAYWSGLMDDCEAEHRFTGDFNGDKHDDFICQSKSKRRLTLKFSMMAGGFDTNKLDAGSFCTDEEDNLLLADVNGDGKKDLVCHHVDKRVELRLNTL